MKTFLEDLTAPALTVSPYVEQTFSRPQAHPTHGGNGAGARPERKISESRLWQHLASGPERARAAKQVATIQRVIAAHFGLSVDQLRKHSRVLRYSWPRALAVFFCRHFTTLPATELGAVFNLERSSVLHAEKKVKSFAMLYPPIGKQVDELRGQLVGR